MQQHVWQANYPTGVPTTINPDVFPSLADFIDHNVQKYADLPAYENMDKVLTYREIGERASAFAAYLQCELGLEKGDRIAVQMPNVLQYPIVLFGAIQAGLTVVNTNPLYTTKEMKHQFQDSGAKAIVVLANFASQLQEVLPETSIKHVIITEVGDMIGGVKGMIVNAVVKYVKKMVPAYDIPQATSFSFAMRRGSQLRGKFVRPDITAHEIAFLQYTGGTTGVAKGAMLTHRNMMANLEQMSAWWGPILREREEVVITALPLYHIFALTVNCFGMMKLGAKSILITNPRDMKAFIAELAKQRWTVMAGVNTLFNGLLNQPDFAKLNFSHLKISVAGGMALQRSVAERWKQVTGGGIVEGYGLTEASPVISCNPVDGRERIGTIGMAMPNTEIMLADDAGNRVPDGERGELWARGPQVMKGYWQRVEATNEVLTEDGWLKTGDVAVFEEDGFMRIVDRKKEMILVSGFNVYPNEVEDGLATHPKILEVGVIGVPDSKSSEAVKAFIVKKDPSLTAEEVIAHAKTVMTGYKVPKHVEFRDELPKSNVGKILRRVLKETDTQKYN